MHRTHSPLRPLGFTLLVFALLAGLVPVARGAPPKPQPERADWLVRDRDGLAALHSPDAATGNEGALQEQYLPWTRIAVETLRDGNPEIYAADDDGSYAVRITNNTCTDAYPRLNLDYTRLAYATKCLGATYEIMIVNPEVCP